MYCQCCRRQIDGTSAACVTCGYGLYCGCGFKVLCGCGARYEHRCHYTITADVTATTAVVLRGR